MIPPAAISGSPVTAATSRSSSVQRHGRRAGGRGERAAVGAGLWALDAQPARAARGRGRRLVRRGDGDPHLAPRGPQRRDDALVRAAEGEADDRGRIGKQGSQLRVPVVVVPVRRPRPNAERGGLWLQFGEVAGERRAVGGWRARHEHVDTERGTRSGPDRVHLGSHGGGGLVTGGQEGQRASGGGGGHQAGRGWSPGHRRHDHRAPGQARERFSHVHRLPGKPDGTCMGHGDGHPGDHTRTQFRPVPVPNATRC